MKSKDWVRLFITTLLIGGATTLIFGLALKWGDFLTYFTDKNIEGIGYLFIWLIGTGFTFSVVSQMGFFAYLTIHRFGLGLFKGQKLWNSVQWLLMLFVIGDILFFRTLTGKQTSLLFDVSLILLILVVGGIVAYKKSKETRKEVFTSAFFFMVFITILEWLPAIRVGDATWMLLMLVTLLSCNAYQMLILHRITGKASKVNVKIA